MAISLREELLSEFLVCYPIADMRTMCMITDGWSSDKPFAKNALNRGSYTIRSMVTRKLMSSRSDGYYSLYKKAADEYYDLEPFYTINGNAKTRKRVAGVAWIASVMKAMGVSLDYDEKKMSFACSTVWRRLNPAVSNTSRYAGVLNLCAEKYAVYDVSDVAMLWQREAEESLFTETPRNKNVALDGILMLADKPLTEQTIDITLRSLKNNSGWRKPKIKQFSLSGVAPIAVSKSFKKAYLMNYEDFANQYVVKYLLKYTPARKWLEQFFDGRLRLSSEKNFDCTIDGKKAFLYLQNDILKLIKMINCRGMENPIIIVCDYRLRGIIDFFFEGKAGMYVVPKEFYEKWRIDNNGQNKLTAIERITNSVRNNKSS